MPTADQTRAPLSHLADRLEGRADTDRVSVGAMMEAAGRRAHGPIILLLAAITVTPIGGIPGASILTGIVLILLGWQMMRGQPPWIPDWIARRSVGADKLKKSLEKSRPAFAKVDKLPRPRLERFVQPPWTEAVAIGVILMGVLLFPLAFVPWGVMAPGIALLIAALGIMGRDGLVTALGVAAMAVAAGVSAYLIYTTLIGG